MNRKWLSGTVAVLLLLAMALGLASAAADTVDLSRMSDAEVTALLDRVVGEMVRRGIEKTATLAKGAYIAGVDIPAGRYVFTCLAKGDDWGSVTVYSDRGEGRQLLWNVVSAPEAGEAPETIYLTLNEGDRLKSDVPFSLTIVAGPAFR